MGVRVSRVGTTSLTLAYQVRSEAAAAVVVDAQSVIVLYDYAKGGKVPIADNLRARIEQLEAASAVKTTT